MSQFSESKTICASAVLCAFDYIKICEDTRAYIRGSNSMFNLVLSGITDTDLMELEEEEEDLIYPEEV